MKFRSAITIEKIVLLPRLQVLQYMLDRALANIGQITPNKYLHSSTKWPFRSTYLWRLKWIIRWKMDVQKKDSSLIWTVWLHRNKLQLVNLTIKMFITLIFF